MVDFIHNNIEEYEADQYNYSFRFAKRMADFAAGTMGVKVGLLSIPATYFLVMYVSMVYAFPLLTAIRPRWRCSRPV